MCKYCKMEQIYKDEYCNEDPNLARIKDGYQLFEVNFNRFVSDKMKFNVLTVDLAIIINDDIYPLETKEIKIKYCPFCGEEL